MYTALYPLYREYRGSGGGGGDPSYKWAVGGVLLAGLAAFAVVFAVNSAVHRCAAGTAGTTGTTGTGTDTDTDTALVRSEARL